MTEEIFIGTKFAKDGYLYINGVKGKKWFSLRRDWQYYWEPVLTQVSRIESIYHKLYTKFELLVEKHKRILHDIVNTVPATDIKGDHVHIVQLPYVPGEESVFGEFKIANPDVVYGITYTTSFIGKDRPLAHPLARQLYDCSERMSSKRKREIGALLHEAIVHYLRNNRSALQDSADAIKGNAAVICLNINNRSYWYRASARYHGYVDYDKITWPGDNMVSMEVK